MIRNRWWKWRQRGKSKHIINSHHCYQYLEVCGNIQNQARATSKRRGPYFLPSPTIRVFFFNLIKESIIEKSQTTVRSQRSLILGKSDYPKTQKLRDKWHRSWV